MIPAHLRPELARHAPRVLLSVVWCLGAEALLWSFPPDRTLLDWLILLAGYAALGYGLADLAVRWRLRDLYGVAALGGIFALVYALTMNPADTLYDLPRTLVTRALGAHGIIAMGMLLFWLALLNVLPLRQLMLPLAALIGLCWGTWARYAPAFIAGSYVRVSLEAFTVIGAVLAALVLILAWLSARMPEVPTDKLLLTQVEAGLVAAAFILLLYRQFDLGAVDMVSRGVVVGLLGLCFAMLWFRKDTVRTYFRAPVRINPSGMLVIVSVVVFLICASVAFGAPVIGDETLNQLTLVIYLFTFFGLAWLPGVAVLLGIRAVLREVTSAPL